MSTLAKLDISNIGTQLAAMGAVMDTPAHVTLDTNDIGAPATSINQDILIGKQNEGPSGP